MSIEADAMEAYVVLLQWGRAMLVSPESGMSSRTYYLNEAENRAHSLAQRLAEREKSKRILNGTKP